MHIVSHINVKLFVFIAHIHKHFIMIKKDTPNYIALDLFA